MTASQQTGGPSVGLRILALAGGLAVVAGAVVLSTSSPAGAEGLERFTSCDELQAHLEASMERFYGGDMAVTEGDMAGGGSDGGGEFRATAGAIATDESAAAPQATAGETNVQVEGVDELDVVEVLDDGRILVVRPDRVLLVDASGSEVLSSLRVGPEAQISFDDERSTLWVVSTDWVTTTLTRSRLDGDAFAGTDTWGVAGHLVSLRRSDDRVHLVAADEAMVMPMAEDAVPFAGTSPVPCDQVLHSPLPGGPATTLVATFAADGDLAPRAATEVVGAGDNVLVTDTALYVSTPSYDGDMTTGIHRFDLDGLTHTGSGSVQGRLLNQFSLDEHEGHLRAAVIAGDGFGAPMPVDDVAIDVVVEPSAASGDAGSALNEIVTLDLDGPLDVVGRSERFGKPGETLHGIRFVGDVAYAVTFLETDPFYVIDLADPGAPAVLGELEIPGFSAYLHPVGEGRVVGFGPDGNGKVAARLFDVTDPAAPRVLDTVSFADDSPVVWDHHALRAAGDRLVVAANNWVAEPTVRCTELAPDDAARAALERRVNELTTELDALYRQLEDASLVPPDGDLDGGGVSSPGSPGAAEVTETTLVPTTSVPEAPAPDEPDDPTATTAPEPDPTTTEPEPTTTLPEPTTTVPEPEPEPVDRAAIEARIAEVQRKAAELMECVYPGTLPRAVIVTLEPSGSSLGVSTVVTQASEAQRVVPLDGGYLVVGTSVSRVGPGGEVEATVA